MANEPSITENVVYDLVYEPFDVQFDSFCTDALEVGVIRPRRLFGLVDGNSMEQMESARLDVACFGTKRARTYGQANLYPS